jgi:hypothetical protein
LKIAKKVFFFLHFPSLLLAQVLRAAQLVSTAQLAFSAAQPSLLSQPRSSPSAQIRPAPPLYSLRRCQVGPGGHPRPPAGSRAEPDRALHLGRVASPAPRSFLARTPRPPSAYKGRRRVRRIDFSPNPSYPCFRAAAAANPSLAASVDSPPRRLPAVVKPPRSSVAR